MIQSQININSFDMFQELLQNISITEIKRKLFIHNGTINRWLKQKRVPENYYNDINHLLGNKYQIKNTYRNKDQFYTNDKISQYCYEKTRQVLKKLEINIDDYIFIEPSAGCCNFYNILTKNKRIGIDIEPKGIMKKELIKINYLDYMPKQNKKYIVIGNPPFGLRGNLALRFINHSSKFADIVAFILPPLFNSTGKGVPMSRVQDYKLAHSEKLPLNSFQYPNGEKVGVATIFQVWTKINTEKIKIEPKKTCKTIAKVYSLSNGGTPSSTRNKNMLDRCDVYLPSTCFKGMKAYKSFNELPNKRGYGVVFYKKKFELNKIFFEKDWTKIAFLSTNSAINLRTDIIENEIIKAGYYDK
ncbi:MAG: restriction endonuclease subunit M [Elusimicrobiota bacterium]|jgi:hypothetical protein|nr:restriction endonuclease subunit M [Elusimicrobiota bacterium]